MDLTYKPVLTQEFEKALATLRTCPFSRLTQKQAEAVVAVLASREDASHVNPHGWSFAQEMDAFTRILPFLISAFNAIDRDADEVISKLEFDDWLENPQLEHQMEEHQWGAAGLREVEASLPRSCKRGLDEPGGLAHLMREVHRLNFQDGFRDSMSLRDFVHLTMTVTAEARRRSGRRRRSAGRGARPQGRGATTRKPSARPTRGRPFESVRIRPGKTTS